LFPALLRIVSRNGPLNELPMAAPYYRPDLDVDIELPHLLGFAADWFQS
jgi:hypothetical protein